MLIRRPREEELADVRALVQAVVDETYGNVWAPPPLPIGDDDWSQGWIALSKTALAGAVLTSKDRIEDLWIASTARRRGIGSALLARGELDVQERGFSTGKLRVVASNATALEFYAKRGWTQVRSFPHEHTGVTMIEHAKLL